MRQAAANEYCTLEIIFSLHPQTHAQRLTALLKHKHNEGRVPRARQQRSILEIQNDSLPPNYEKEVLGTHNMHDGGALHGMYIGKLTDVTLEDMSKVTTKNWNDATVPGGPDYYKGEGAFVDLFHAKDAAIGSKIEMSVLNAIKQSHKWNPKDRFFGKATYMASNDKSPQYPHLDWKKDYLKDGRNRPLSAMIATTTNGFYVQYWDSAGYGYVVHIKFGEVLIFDSTCRHGGNLGGSSIDSNYPRIHCFCILNTNQLPDGGPYYFDDENGDPNDYIYKSAVIQSSNP